MFDAELVVADAAVPEDVSPIVHPQPPSGSELPQQSPVRTKLSLSTNEVDALVVVNAVALALQRGCTNVILTVRRTMLAFAQQGYACGRTGYHLRLTRQRRGRSHAHEQRRWQEALSRELLSQHRSSAGPFTLQHVREAFQQTIYMMRFVCGTQPGPRFAWPGFLPLTPKYRRDHQATVEAALATPPLVLLQAISTQLDELQRLVLIVQSEHNRGSV